MMMMMERSHSMRSVANAGSRIPVPVPRENTMRTRTNSAPSKLEQLQMQYQRHLYREKEDKLLQLYQHHHQKTLQRLFQDNYPDTRGNVREFFSNQRQQNGFVDRNPVQMRENSQPQQYYYKPTGAAAKPPLPQKRSAGRDKANPLAPIDRPSQPHATTQFAQIHSPKPPPFETKPKLMRSNRRTTASPEVDIPAGYTQHAQHVSTQKAVRPISNGYASDDDLPVSQRKTNALLKRRKQQENGSEKLSDFEKWQLEQDRAKEKRLNNYRQYARTHLNSEGEEQDMNHNKGKTSSRLTPVSGRSDNPPTGRNTDRGSRVSGQQDQLQSARSGRSSSRINVDETEAKIKAMEAELHAKIAEQQDMLHQMKQERAKEEEKEQKEAEMRKEREKEQAERRRRLHNAQRAASQSSVHATPPPDPTPTPTYQPPKQRVRSAKRNDNTPTPTPKYQPPKPPVKTKKRHDSSSSTKHTDTAFYEQVAATAEAQPEPMDLVPCRQCGRSFAAERLAQHSRVCSKASKKRKVFDPVKMRTQGTDAEKYASLPEKFKAPPKEKKSDWRQKHNDFMETIQYAKKVSAVEAQGGNIADLPPPPPSHNPDYVQCPHCQRRFNQGAADRHIPACKSIKSKPSPLRRRR